MDIKTLQTCLNTLFQFPVTVDGFGRKLDVDGVSGYQTQTALDGITRKDFKGREIKSIGIIKTIQEIYKKKGYFFDNTFEFLAVRTSDDLYKNTMDDFAILIIKGAVYIFPFATKPAKTAVIEDALMWVNGVQGVGCLKEGQYLKTFRIYTPDKWFWSGGLPFGYQEKDVIVFRDKDGNGFLDRSVIQKGKFGINIHSWKNWLSRTLSYWQAGKGIALTKGCQVTDEKSFNELFGYVMAFNPDLLFSYTLLNISDFPV